jgi:hypothetical protein
MQVIKECQRLGKSIPHQVRRFTCLVFMDKWHNEFSQYFD